MNRIGTLALLAALAGPTSAFAANELLTNGSFEGVPDLAYGSYGYWNTAAPVPMLSSGVPGWIFDGAAASNSATAWDTRGSLFGAGLGTIYAALQSTSSFYTTFTSPVTSAVLSWFDAGRNYEGSYNGDQSYRVTVSSAAGTLWTAVFSTFSGSGPTEHSQALTLFAGTEYTLTFTGLNAADNTALIDGVSVTAVPGPVAAAGLPGLMALVGFGLYRRRRRAA